MPANRKKRSKLAPSRYIVKDMGPGVNGYYCIVDAKEETVIVPFICQRVDAEVWTARLNVAYREGRIVGLLEPRP
jgi:hypothetical protein